MKELASITLKDLARLSSKDLLTVYNLHALKPISRFADYPSALRRTRALLSLQQSTPVKLVPSEKFALGAAKPKDKKARTKVFVAPVSKPSDVKEHHSVLAAFKALGLPIAKHQRFRRQLKLSGKATFDQFIFVATY